MPALFGLAFLVFDVVSGSGYGDGGNSSDEDDLDPDMSDDPSVPLGFLSVTGKGGGMPVAYPSAQSVAIYADRATITPGLTEFTLPLAQLQIVSARRVGVRWTRRKAVDAQWSVETEGQNLALTFRGRWLLLAQLGNLAGWSEPN